MKKAIYMIVSGAVLIALLLGLLAGCAVGEAPAAHKLTVVCTVYPLYEWALALTKDRAEHVEVRLLVQNGADLHSYQPSVEDMVRISGCDVFLFVGGESDGWVHDALAQRTNPDMTVLNCLDLLGDAARLEQTDGIQAPEEEDEGPAYDEHIWLSPKTVRQLLPELAAALSAKDPDGQTAYEAALADYDKALSALDEGYARAAAEGTTRTLLVADRFPLRYLTQDYGLDYYAAFSGCSTQTEASFETIAFLAGKADELELPAVLCLEGGDHRLAQTVIETTVSHPPLLVLDSMQSVTPQALAEGPDYLSRMADNLALLRQALGAPATED